MRKLKNIFLLTLLSAISFTACVDDADIPGEYVPVYKGDANLTIKELKEKYAKIINDNSLKEITEDYVIKGFVTGNDISGNIYKTLFIQDETGGLNIAIDADGLNASYCLGQEVFVNLKGLYIGGYGNSAQLGYTYNKVDTTNNSTKVQIGRMSKFMWQDHAFKNGLAKPSTVPTPIIINNESEIQNGYDGMLVTVKGVSFNMAGFLTMAEDKNIGAGTDSRQLNIEGGTLTLRTSRYASGIATLILPEGKGDITGILTSYRGSWQLTVREASDFQGYVFQNQLSPHYILETFSDELGVFKSISDLVNATGRLSWTIDFSSAMIKGYVDGKNIDAITYLVSNSINLSAGTPTYITFDHAINFADSKTLRQNHQLLISKDFNGNVNDAHWTSLDTYMPSGSSFDFINSGKVIVPQEFLGQKNVTVALRQISTTTKGSTWEVRNFIVAPGEGEVIKDPTNPDGAIYFESFANGFGGFTIQDVIGNTNWQADTERGFVKISGNGRGVNEDWLISPKLDLSTYQGVKLHFMQAINFALTDEARKSQCKLMISTDYNSGKPETATWTELTIPTYPTSDSWNFIGSGTIDLPSVNNVHFAFKYSCPETNAAYWEIKDVIVK